AAMLTLYQNPDFGWQVVRGIRVLHGIRRAEPSGDVALRDRLRHQSFNPEPTANGQLCRRSGVRVKRAGDCAAHQIKRSRVAQRAARESHCPKLGLPTWKVRIDSNRGTVE